MESQCLKILPCMKSPTSPGKKEVPRVQNKCLITWGFTSTSFTAEELTHNATWMVTVERNTGHWGTINTGYLFGIGIATDTLNFKDLVGMNERSYGIICSGGGIFFSHNSAMEHLMQLDQFPLHVTVSVNVDNPGFTVFSYQFENATWGVLLKGKKILHAEGLKNSLYPVFTVSQRMKLLFPIAENPLPVEPAHAHTPLPAQKQQIQQQQQQQQQPQQQQQIPQQQQQQQSPQRQQQQQQQQQIQKQQQQQKQQKQRQQTQKQQQQKQQPQLQNQQQQQILQQVVAQE